MSLRFKLLLIALSTLALPVAGWLFVRQMEELLRQGQEQTLIASARALARSLNALNAELPPGGNALYVHRAPAKISVDGSGDDWSSLKPYTQFLGPANDAEKLSMLLRNDDDVIYMLIAVRDATRTRMDARDPRAMTSDHLILTLQRDDLTRRYLIASAAPGPFDALTLTDATDNALPTVLDGVWQENGSGYVVELRMPRAQMPDRLSIASYDAETSTETSSELMPLLTLSTQLSNELSQFIAEGMRARILSGDGWVIATAGALSAPPAQPVARRRWLENFVYRHLLAPSLIEAADFSIELPRLNATEIWQALSGVTSTAWHRTAADSGVVLAAAVPLKSQGEVRGALLLEQASETLPLLTNRALISVATASLFALFVAGGILFLFSSVLSLRIRRLRDAADRALRNSGSVDTAAMPLTDSRDELGDLARSFSGLLAEVSAYTDYLRTLASKLSHELQTPLAIVKSSLDNLEHQSMPDAAQPYLERARGGAERLGAIVRAMSQANGMERAIGAAEGEDFDLTAVVRGCIDSYRSIIAPRRLESELPTAPLIMHGAPELIAQALDKLVDNARSFAPDDGWIRIALHALDDGAELTVANSGSLLPDTMQDRLFDSLVSLRPSTQRAAEAPHLGLGLYIVRLIASAHRGAASARNLADGSGVEFKLVLRSMPRRPLV
ncbi:MAG TPA: ATP-binding protein [Rudaea sp.]|nr:ATP-binding protein [Rudaea sp.]